MTKKQRSIIKIFFESLYGALTPDKSEQAEKTAQAYRSFRAKAQSQRKPIEVAADSITAFFGSIAFAMLHIIWFIVWIVINTGLIPNILPFDPFPFGLLTMIVSLEAIFLSVFVLISQNRESQISDLRQELDFQINTHAEQEVTKLIKMVEQVHEHLGIKTKNDKELTEMRKRLDTDKLEEEIKEENQPAKN